MSAPRLQTATSGPLLDKEISELDDFFLGEEALDEAMDVCTLDGFLCAVLSGPKLILPSEWTRWVWDMEQGEQSASLVRGVYHRRIDQALRVR